jgi:hypothetical protein
MIPQILLLSLYTLGSVVEIRQALKLPPFRTRNKVLLVVTTFFVVHGLLLWGGFYDCFF